MFNSGSAIMKYLLLTIALFLLIAQSALAQQEVTTGNDFGIGARAMGMGGAFIGIADDSTALHWNPSGLSQIKRTEFFFGLSHERLETDTVYFGNSDSTFASNTRFNSLGIVLPVPVRRGGLAFAIGVNRVQSFDSRVRLSGLAPQEDPEFYDLFLEETIAESDGMYSWNFGAAVVIAPGVSIGGSLNFLSGDYEYNLSQYAEDIQEIDDLATYERWEDVYTNYFGVESKIGLLARIGKQIKLGATIDIPLELSVGDLDESWVQQSIQINDDGTDSSSFEDGYTHEYNISRPFRFGAGIAAAIVPGVVIAADALYTDWTQTEYDRPPTADITNEVFHDDYRDTLQLRLGAEFAIPKSGMRLRAGYMRDPLPYDPDYKEIDTERQFLTAGIGMILDRTMSLDIAYMRGFWDETIDDGDIEQGKDTNRIFLSAGYRF